MNTREDLISAATRVFASKGYSAASLRDIAEAAGIQRGSVYHHVASKEQLLLEGLVPPLEETTIQVEAVVDTSLLKGDVDFAKSLGMAISTHLHCLYGNEDLEGVKIYLTENLLASHSDLTSTAKSRLRALTSRHQANFTRLVKAGVESGAFRSDVDPKLAAFLILGMCNWVSRWYRSEAGWSLDEISEAITSIVLGGLGS